MRACVQVRECVRGRDRNTENECERQKSAQKTLQGQSQESTDLRLVFFKQCFKSQCWTVQAYIILKEDYEATAYLCLLGARLLM